MISDLDLQLISTYLIALFTGGWIWDFLFSIQEDYQVVAKFPLMLPSATFFFSRLTTFVFLILTVTIDLFDTYGSYGGGSLPGQDGYRLSIATGWFFCVRGNFELLAIPLPNSRSLSRFPWSDNYILHFLAIHMDHLGRTDRLHSLEVLWEIRIVNHGAWRIHDYILRYCSIYRGHDSFDNAHPAEELQRIR